MHEEIYADGIGEITVSGTIVRIDLVSLSPTERDAFNQPKPAFRQRIVMSVDGFANSVDLMQKALQGLIDGGAITRTAVGNGLPVAQESRSKRQRAEATRGNGSPNFG